MTQIDPFNFGISPAMFRTMADRLTGEELATYRDRLQNLADFLDPNRAEALPSPERQAERREKLIRVGERLAGDGLDVEVQDPDTLEVLDDRGRLLGTTRWTSGVPVFTPNDQDAQWSALVHVDGEDGDDD